MNETVGKDPQRDRIEITDIKTLQLGWGKSVALPPACVARLGICLERAGRNAGLSPNTRRKFTHPSGKNDRFDLRKTVVPLMFAIGCDWRLLKRLGVADDVVRRIGTLIESVNARFDVEGYSPTSELAICFTNKDSQLWREINAEADLKIAKHLDSDESTRPERRHVRDRIKQAVLGLISEGHLKLGTPIDIRLIKDKLQQHTPLVSVGRDEIEALLGFLAQQGIVVPKNGRYLVKELSEETWNELLEYRTAIEVINIRSLVASPKKCAITVTGLVDPLKDMADALVTDDAAKFFEADTRFHLALAYCSVAAYHALTALLPFVQLAAQRFSTPEHMQTLFQDHEKIHMLIADRADERISKSDPEDAAELGDQAEALVQDHLRLSRSLYCIAQTEDESSSVSPSNRITNDTSS